jgi:cob(I)alamin adenosyltransferase
MSVYTKTGDRGETSLFSGKRVSKNSKLINAIGTVDELNSYLGIIGGLSKIQKDLFAINAIIAGFNPAFPKNSVKRLEEEIDNMEGKLPVQKNFLIYSGTLKSRRLYFARSLCRRAERALVALPIPHSTSYILQYINRLSDYLFILARYTNFKKGIREKVWKIVDTPII